MEQLTSQEYIRMHTLKRRAQMSCTERSIKSAEIARKLFQFPQWAGATVVHVYVSTLTEVHTSAIIAEGLAAGKRIVIPISHPPGNRHGPRKLAFGAPLTLSEWATGNTIDPDEVDLWIVPGVAFDPNGNRIGRGSGCYDRLLSGRHGWKVALAFDVQIVSPFNLKATDVLMDLVLTETQTIIRGNSPLIKGARGVVLGNATLKDKDG